MIYFNNTATSFPKPQEVLDAVNEFNKIPPIHAARVGFEREPDDVIFNCRESLAKLFNVDDPERIMLTSGSTEALNLAIFGLQLNNAHVITTVLEHNSVIRPLKHLERDGAIELTFLECDENSYIDPLAFKTALKPNTKAIVVNHSSNVTGGTLDLQAIAKVAHDGGAVLIVDASQSAGSIPIDCKNWDIDLLAFTGHKSLFGMQGTGGLYIKPGINLKPLKVGGTGVKSEVLYQPEDIPLYYEAGTPNMPGIVSLNAGVRFVLEKGVDHIHETKANMIKRMIAELQDYPEIKIYTKGENNSYVNFCFNIEGMVPEEVGYALDSCYDIIVRTGLHCAPLILKPIDVYPWGTVRVSPGYFSTTQEIDTFIEAIKDIIKTFVRKGK
jgi:cysteine desulfurase family protein